MAPRIQPFAVRAGQQGPEAPLGRDLDSADLVAQLVRACDIPLQVRERCALGLGQGRGRLGAPGRFLDPRRRSHNLAPHDRGAGHPGHLAVAGRQGVLQPGHVAAQAVQLAGGAQAVAVLKGSDRLIERAAMTLVVAGDGPGPERLAVGPLELAQGCLAHGHVVALVLTARTYRTIKTGPLTSPT